MESEAVLRINLSLRDTQKHLRSTFTRGLLFDYLAVLQADLGINGLCGGTESKFEFEGHLGNTFTQTFTQGLLIDYLAVLPAELGINEL